MIQIRAIPNTCKAVRMGILQEKNVSRNKIEGQDCYVIVRGSIAAVKGLSGVVLLRRRA